MCARKDACLSYIWKAWLRCLGTGGMECRWMTPTSRVPKFTFDVNLDDINSQQGRLDDHSIDFCLSQIKDCAAALWHFNTARAHLDPGSFFHWLDSFFLPIQILPPPSLNQPCAYFHVCHMCSYLSIPAKDLVAAPHCTTRALLLGDSSCAFGTRCRSASHDLEYSYLSFMQPHWPSVSAMRCTKSQSLFETIEHFQVSGICQIMTLVCLPTVGPWLPDASPMLAFVRYGRWTHRIREKLAMPRAM